MHSSGIYLRKALDVGASAYVLKSGAAEELLTAIETARSGGCFVSPGFGARVIESVEDWPAKSSRLAVGLTDRQRQILQLIAEGRLNKEIAHLLHVSVKTVEYHRGALMKKLGAHTAAELTVFAIQEGLISPVE